VADGVNPVVHGMEPGMLDPVVDCPRRDPELQKLAPSDDAVLALRQSREGPVESDPPTSGHFSTTTGVK
jgi:hypothetical protein